MVRSEAEKCEIWLLKLKNQLWDENRSARTRTPRARVDGLKNFIDAQASCTLTRGLKTCQSTRTRQPRVRVGVLVPQAQHWHSSGTTLWKMAGHWVQHNRRARAHHAHAWMAFSGRTARTHQVRPRARGHSAKNFLS